MEQLAAFFAEAANWQGETGIPNRLVEHLAISLLAVLTASAIALPLGFYIGHTGRLQLLGINIANIGRAVPSYAVMVMLLPVMLGLAPVLVDQIFETIKQLHAAGTTILLVEQNARIALQVASRGYVLQSGSVVLSDTAENLERNEMVREAYLGE